jgi:hypothetical protein
VESGLTTAGSVGSASGFFTGWRLCIDFDHIEDLIGLKSTI